MNILIKAKWPQIIDAANDLGLGSWNTEDLQLYVGLSDTIDTISLSR